MKDVPNIEGVPDPRKSKEINQEGEIDPEKFKRIMKVDESDEPEKREKRNRTKQQEEEEEVDETEQSPDPSTQFGEFLSEPSDTDSVFDPKAGAKQSVGSSDPSETPDTAPTPFSTYEQTRTPPPAQQSGVEEAGGGMEVSVPEGAQSGPAEPEHGQTHDDKKKKKADETKPLEKPPEKVKAKAKEEHILPEEVKPAAKAPEKNEKKGKELPIGKSLASEKTPEKTPDKPVQLEGTEKFDHRTKQKEATIENVVLPEEVEKKATSAPVSHEQPVEMKTTASVEKEMQKEDENADDDEKKEKQETAAAMAPPEVVPTEQLQAPMPSGPVSPFSHLSPEVFDLFERMVGLMTIEKDKGEVKTTVKITMPGSVFHNCKIVLEHHPAAAKAMNVSLQGNPKAVELFTSNMGDLVAAFEQNKMAFQVNVRTPSLLEEYRYLVKRKEKAMKDDREKGGDKSDD